MSNFYREPFVVYVITDATGAATVAALRPASRLAVQLRDRTAGGALLAAAADKLVGAGHRVYINDRVDVALACGCEGVHLGKDAFTVSAVRRIGNSLRIGVSVHSLEGVQHAKHSGADFCVLSPIFQSPGKGAPLGITALRQAALTGLPVYALGGVDKNNARACLDVGATGVAAIRSGAALAEMLCK